jgi:regulator of protease activity HflC (stomatin/prohibitin superfamily)
MLTKIRVKLNERVVMFRHGVPKRALGPGRHVLWLGGWTEQRFATDRLVFEALPEVRAVLPSEWFAEVVLDARQRGVLYADGRPRVFLRPGTHRYWTVDASVRLDVHDVREPMPELTDELVRVIPSGEYVLTVVRDHERGLRYVQGRLAGVLEPGRYAEWTHPEAQVEIRTMDVRLDQLQLAGQELMTRDKVTLRLTLTAEYAVEDPALAARATINVPDTVYLMVQLAARDYVAATTLDTLLEGRDAMQRYLEEQTVPQARAIGVRIARVGIKDVVLPGEMKTLLNRVIEAEKEAAANVILRREEAATTRTMANAARVMADNPALMRLKELETLKDVAERIHEVRVVIGADGLADLLPAQLLGRGTERSNT